MPHSFFGAKLFYSVHGRHLFRLIISRYVILEK
nr:MAG TPA: hypothetical protein [Caudoviricetes sp.]